MNRGYKFRIYPNDEQKVLLSKMFGCNRFVYNYFLNQRKEFYLANKDQKKRGLNYNDNCSSLVKLKKTEETKWLTEVDSQSLQQSLRDLDAAYLKFFRKQAQFPQFKSKHDKQSCRFVQRFELKDSVLSLPKIGDIEIVQHRKIPSDAKLCNVTVSKNKTGQYFASICVDETILKLPVATKNVGIDLGLKSFAAMSDGTVITNPKISWKRRKKMAHLQRQHSRKKKDSRNREKARVKVAREHQKISNRKSDFSHKLSRKIVNENQVIAVEDLNVAGMVKNRRLARSISEVSWAEFVKQLEYKSLWAGRTFVKVNRFFPSSKLCSCGFIYDNLKLKDREWTCPKCHTTHDRDLNAARNILKQGLILSGVGQPSDGLSEKSRETPKQKLGKASGSRVSTGSAMNRSL